MSQKDVATHLKITQKQVGFSLRCESVTPEKCRARDQVLFSETLCLIENFVKASPENRQMAYFELAYEQF